MITLTGKVTVRGLGCTSRDSSSVCMVGVKGLKTYYRRIGGPHMTEEMTAER
jgi:hypothetical protein